MPRIPIDTLRIRPYSSTRIGRITVCNTTLPVMVITMTDGVTTVEMTKGAESLGEWLADVSQRIGQEQLESLLEGKVIIL